MDANVVDRGFNEIFVFCATKILPKCSVNSKSLSCPCLQYYSQTPVLHFVEIYAKCETKIIEGR
jgi:hypothetical protein